MRVEYDYKDRTIFYNVSLDNRDYSLLFSYNLIKIKSNNFRVSLKVFKVFKCSIF